MADYSGDPDPWITSLRFGIWDDKVWSSYKGGGWGVEAPREFLGLLIDGHKDGMKRNLKHYVEQWHEKGMPRPVIRWNAKRGVWTMTGGFHYSDKGAIDWLTRNGYDYKTGEKIG